MSGEFRPRNELPISVIAKAMWDALSYCKTSDQGAGVCLAIEQLAYQLGVDHGEFRESCGIANGREL